MKNKFFCVVIIFFCVFPTYGIARNLPKAPESVTFFAREARLVVTEKLQTVTEGVSGRESNIVRVKLPAGMIRESFSIEINDEPVTSYSWVQKNLPSPENPPLALLPESENDPERKKLLSAYVALGTEAARLKGDKIAFETRLAFWKSQAGQIKATGSDSGKNSAGAYSVEVAKVDSLIGERIPAIESGLQKTDRMLEQTNQLVTEARRALNRYDSARAGETVIVPVRQAGEIRARYRYTLPTACTVRYHVNAHPEKSLVDIASLADLMQSSGIDWNGVEVSLALVGRSPAPYPPTPAPWIVDFAKDVDKKPMMSSRSIMQEQRMPSPSAIPAAEDEEEFVAAPRIRLMPVQAEMATFRLWKLGKRDMKHDSSITVQLADDKFKADFYYTLRPQSERRGFLTAHLAFDTPVEMAKGQADCFVDDNFVGSQSFQIAGKKSLLYFGTDPMITAQVHDLINTRGEQGLIARSQTKTWHWNITVTNSRSRPVDVRVEEPAPISHDTSIVVKSAATPAPESDNMYSDDELAHPALRWNVWKKHLPPGENFVIDWQVTMEAPTGKTLLPGR